MNQPTPLPVSASRCARLAQQVSDGEPHTVASLAIACESTHEDIEATVVHLQSLGMQIVFAKGLVRATPFTALDAQVLQAVLDEANPSRGWSAQVALTTPSTNASLMRDVRQGTVATPCVLTTDFQSDGRGRRGRSWRSVPGASLTVSFALASEHDLVALEGVTLACGLAVRDTLQKAGVDAELKWPNDVVVGGRKLAGILVESVRTVRTVLVIGIGINVTPLPEDEGQGYLPADLQSCGITSCDRHRLIADLAGALAARVRAIERTGFAPMAPEYNSVDAFRDRRVALTRAEGQATTGIERGVDARGALCIDTDAGRLTVIAGDVVPAPRGRMNDPTLLVDIGNTRVKWAIVDGSRPIAIEDARSSPHDDLPDFESAGPSVPRRAVYSNVASPALATTMFAALRERVVIEELRSSSEACGVVNGYRRPEQLGADRWAALIGAHSLVPDRDLLVCSFGTATTIDLLMRDRADQRLARFVGGLILPGVQTMRRSLARETARLPMGAGTPTDFATDTDDAIASGIVAAQVGAVEQAVARAWATHGLHGLLILVAGGAAPALDGVAIADAELRREPDLVLLGLGVVARQPVQQYDAR